MIKSWLLSLLFLKCVMSWGVMRGLREDEVGYAFKQEKQVLGFEPQKEKF